VHPVLLIVGNTAEKEKWITTKSAHSKNKECRKKFASICSV